MMTHHELVPQIDEAKVRIENVNRQRDIEEELIGVGRGQVIFFVPTPLTPFFINPAAVTQNKDGLYVLKEGYTIPDGLIPIDKQHNPAQLSTVLGRVLTVTKMLEVGINITVFCTTFDRPKADDKAGHVDPRYFNATQQMFTNLRMVNISSEKYASLKDTLPAAAYFYHQQIVAVYSQQIRENFDPTRKWSVEDQNRAFLQPMRELCRNSLVMFPLDLHSQTNAPIRLSLTRQSELTNLEKKKFYFFP